MEVAREHGIYVIHDLAYADLVFDGYVAPSIMQVPGAKEIAVEVDLARGECLSQNRDVLARLRERAGELGLCTGRGRRG